MRLGHFSADTLSESFRPDQDSSDKSVPAKLLPEPVPVPAFPVKKMFWLVFLMYSKASSSWGLDWISMSGACFLKIIGVKLSKRRVVAGQKVAGGEAKNGQRHLATKMFL